MYITENDKIAIRTLVEKQVEAFRKNDLNTAFSLTVFEIQEKLEPDDFMARVSEKYYPIVKHKSLMFQGFTLVNDYPALVAMIMDCSGKLIQAIFIVKYQQGFGWRICGYELHSVARKISRSW